MPGTMSIGGLASGLKVDDIIAKYMEYARRPQKKLQADKARSQLKLAAWQDLNTRVLALQTKCDAIGTSSGFQGKKASSSLETIATVNATSDATPGTYYISINESAKSHQIASQTFGSLDSTVAAGDINITVSGVTTKVTIDSNNNTLVGVKDAINRSGAAVRAAVVNEGTAANPAYSLQITSTNTGTANAMTIDPGTTGLNIDTTDLGTRVVQAADDAEIQMGSITFTRSTNSINDIIPGVTINIISPDNTKTVKIDVARDTATTKDAIKAFVSQYNDLMKVINDQFEYDSQTGESGTLMGSFELQTVQMDLESMVTGIVSGIPYDPTKKNYTSLSSIGITLGTDGSLSVNDSELSSALENNASDVARIFSTTLDSDSAYVSLASSTSDTKASGIAGYDIDITQAATRAQIRAGKAWLAGDILNADEILTINTTQISLTAGMTLTQVINTINAASTTTNVSAFQSVDGSDYYLNLRALQYGSNRDFKAISDASNLAVLDPGKATSGLGRVEVSITMYSGENGLGQGTAGQDVAGTINGERCKGNGQVLTADPEDANSKVKGLSVLATSSSTMSTSARFIKGVGAGLKDLLASMTSSSGVFTFTQESLNTEIDAYDDDIADMETRMQSQQDRLYEQFNRMETQLAQLQNQGNYLSAQLGALTKQN
ncbi:MAG: flagellar filament capping protein FliD [Armatimonadetes bacterium]|nr:flagellar filament capping protein FliD [Armatimonadota bacterium]